MYNQVSVKQDSRYGADERDMPSRNRLVSSCLNNIHKVVAEMGEALKAHQDAIGSAMSPESKGGASPSTPSPAGSEVLNQLVAINEQLLSLKSWVEDMTSRVEL